MKALAILAIVLTTVTLATVATVAIWASIADAPWEDEATEEAAATPAPKPAANFTASDVVHLTEALVAERASFPGRTEWVRCVDASFRSGNGVWVVTCEFTINRNDATAQHQRIYTFDDRTGELR